MDQKIINAFIYLAKSARIPVYEQDKLIDIICEHDYILKENNTATWHVCIVCGRVKDVIRKETRSE